MKYEKLYKYIPYFNKNNSVIVHIGNGIGNIKYDTTFKQFIEDVYATDVINYSSMYKHEMSRKTIDEIMFLDIDSVKAMIAHYVRAERFCDGAWQSAVKKGYFKVLLNRLFDLDNMI